MEIPVWNDHLRELYRPILEHPDDLAPRFPFADALCELEEVWVPCPECKGRKSVWRPPVEHVCPGFLEPCSFCHSTGRHDKNSTARKGGEYLIQALRSEGPPRNKCFLCHGTGRVFEGGTAYDSSVGEECSSCKGAGLINESPRLPFSWMNKNFYWDMISCFHQPSDITKIPIIRPGYPAGAWVWKGLIRQVFCTEVWAGNHLGKVLQSHPVTSVTFAYTTDRGINFQSSFPALNNLRAGVGLPPYVPGSRFQNAYEVRD